MTDKIAEELAEQFLALGWTEYPSQESKQARAFHGPRLRGEDCECNDKPPSLYVEVYQFDRFQRDTWGETLDRCSFKIFGEKGGMWLRSTIYSVPNEKVIESIPEVTRRAENLWAAWCSTSEVE